MEILTWESLKSPCTVSSSKHSNEHPCILAEMTVHGKLTPIKWRELKKGQEGKGALHPSHLGTWMHAKNLSLNPFIST